MNPEIGFVAALLSTVALLVVAAVLGRKRRIKPHVIAVFSAVGTLGVAIWFALQVGELYDLEAAGAITPIHLNLARFTTLFLLWPLLTGPLVAKGKLSGRIHRYGAWTAFVLVLLATVTGLMMLLGAERLPSADEGGSELRVEEER